MSAPPPHTHISMGKTHNELNRVAPGNTSATTGARNTSVSAGKARFQPGATVPSPAAISAPPKKPPGPGSCSRGRSGYSRARPLPVGPGTDRDQTRSIANQVRCSRALLPSGSERGGEEARIDQGLVAGLVHVVGVAA